MRIVRYLKSSDAVIYLHKLALPYEDPKINQHNIQKKNTTRINRPKNNKNNNKKGAKKPDSKTPTKIRIRFVIKKKKSKKIEIVLENKIK